VDPGLFSLKSAARAAIVMPSVFAFADKVIKDPQTATFAAFGSFAILVLADFSGPRRTRLVAYLALAAAGAVLIVLGTLCSRNAWLAAAAMAVVGFAVLFSARDQRLLRGRGTAAMLTFRAAGQPSREPFRDSLALGGWLWRPRGDLRVMLLWPTKARDNLRAGIARACVALADLVESELARDPSLVAERAGAAREAVAGVRQEFFATPTGRPVHRSGGGDRLPGRRARLVSVLRFSRRGSPSPD